MANHLGHQVSSLIPDRHKQLHTVDGDKQNFAFINMHLIYDFFATQIKEFATHYNDILSDHDVGLTKQQFAEIFDCCDRNQPDVISLESVEGMLLSHMTRLQPSLCVEVIEDL